MYFQRPDAGEGDRETGIMLSRVLPEASGGATVEIQGAGLEGPLA